MDELAVKRFVHFVTKPRNVNVHRGEDKNWCLHAAVSKRCQHLQAVAARKHEIQNDKVELLGIYEEKPLLSSGSKDDLVFLALQSFPECTGDFGFVFDDKNSQAI